MNNSVPLCHSATVPYLPFRGSRRAPAKPVSLSIPTERYSRSSIRKLKTSSRIRVSLRYIHSVRSIRLAVYSMNHRGTPVDGVNKSLYSMKISLYNNLPSKDEPSVTDDFGERHPEKSRNSFVQD